MAERRNPILPNEEFQPLIVEEEKGAEAWLDYLPPPKKKAKRSRGWEKAHQAVLYRGVPRATRDIIRDISRQLNVVVDDLARAFLEFSLECIRNGTLRLEAHPSIRPKAPRMTLFPFRGAGWAVNGWTPIPVDSSSKRRSKSSVDQPWKSVAAYRLPKELHQRVKNLASDYLPVGEVAAVLLQHGLQSYLQGVLILRPQPKQDALLGWDAGFEE